MRETAETPDDIPVRHRITQILRVSESDAERNGAVLVAQVFAMLERQIKKRAAIGIQTKVKPARQRKVGDRRASPSVAKACGVPR
jgi:hypothetical protein